MQARLSRAPTGEMLALGAGTAVLAMALGVAVVRYGPALPLGVAIAGLVLAVAGAKPVSGLAIVAAASGFAADMALPIGFGGATAIALVCLVACPPSLARLRHILRGGWWVPLVLVCLWLSSAIINDSVVEVRPYVTRLIVLPILIAVVTATAVRLDPTLRRSVAWPVWIVAVVGALVAESAPGAERAGVLGNYGAWSTYLIVAAAAAYALAGRRPMRLIVLLSPVIIALLATGTRSSVGAALAAVALSAFMMRPGAASTAVPRLVLVVAVFAGLLISPLGGATLNRLSGSDVGAERSNHDRAALAETALRAGLERPALGMGPGTFSERYTDVRVAVGGPPVIDAASSRVESHSFYAGFFAETGVLSWAVMALAVLAVVRMRLPVELRWLRAALLAVLLAGTVANVELHLSLPLMLGLVLGASAGRTELEPGRGVWRLR